MSEIKSKFPRTFYDQFTSFYLFKPFISYDTIICATIEQERGCTIPFLASEKLIYYYQTAAGALSVCYLGFCSLPLAATCLSYFQIAPFFRGWCFFLF